jgi:hypothetical protein
MNIGGPRGLLGIPLLSNFTLVFIVFVMSVVIIRNFVYSRHGRACIAIRENEVAAHLMGINITKYKVMAFVIGSTFAGIGGALLAHFIQMLHPTMGGFMKSVEYLIMVYLGGMGAFPGRSSPHSVSPPSPSCCGRSANCGWCSTACFSSSSCSRCPAALWESGIPFLVPKALKERQKHAQN